MLELCSVLLKGGGRIAAEAAGIGQHPGCKRMLSVAPVCLERKRGRLPGPSVTWSLAGQGQCSGQLPEKSFGKGRGFLLNLFIFFYKFVGFYNCNSFIMRDFNHETLLTRAFSVVGPSVWNGLPLVH